MSLGLTSGRDDGILLLEVSMAYRHNGIECDTLEELRALQTKRGVQRPEEVPAPPGYNFHPKYRCKEYILGQTGPGLGYERCGFREGHSGPCEA